MKQKHLLLILAVSTLAIGIPAYAHHSFAADYFEDQTMSIEGQLSQFDYRNPHAWVHLMAKDKDGQVRQYSAEWGNLNRLKGQNITKDTLKPGDYVLVSGSPSRDAQARKLHLKSIERPSDGWKWGNLNGRR